MKNQNTLSSARVSGQSNTPMARPAHALTCEQVIKELNANDQDGLKSQDAKQRLEEHGPNEFEGNDRVSAPRILVGQLANAMTLVLIIAMAVSFGIKSYIEGGFIALVIVINVVVGFWQEFGAERTMDSLRSLSSPTATVVRDGNSSTVPTRFVVPGDMIELKTGDTVPADVRLIEAVNFETDEALLTGEPLPIEKITRDTFEENTGPGDRLNIAFSSTTVTSGRARAIVFATGMHTEVGAIAADLQGKGRRRRKVRRDADGSALPHRYLEAWTLTIGDALGRFLGVNVGTPLQKKLARLALFLFGVAIVCAIIVLAANRMADYPPIEGSDPEGEIAIYAVATGLSMLPACLTVVLTICMANGAKRMVEKNVIVRQQQALENLGSVTDINSDKTGTLTQGIMMARKVWIPSQGTYSVERSSEPYNPYNGGLKFEESEPRSHVSSESEKSDYETPENLLNDNEALLEFIKISSLANVAHVHETEGEWKARGDPTSVAIMVFAARFGWNKADKNDWHQIAEFPFDSDVKKMSVVAEEPSTGQIFTFTKGAVERVLKGCNKIAINGEGLTDLTDEIEKRISENVEALSASGLRVLALASKPMEKNAKRVSSKDRDAVESNLVFRGLVGIEDPPRPESASSVQTAHEAGIRVRMLTGDHLATARSIATQIGILPRMDTFSKPVADAMVMTAAQFDSLSDSQIDRLPVLPLVLARCTPNTKVRMVEALHRRGAIAAMTGDGVNDAPSLKRADVGIAMGKAGSDVAKSAADIILTDDNFASIINAIEEGRRTASNISKFVLHLLSQNVAQALVLLIGLMFKDGRDLSTFPISPVQIVWIIMVTSSLPDMGLSFEKADPDILSRPPTSKKGIFKWELIIDMFVYGVLIAALTLGAFTLVVFGFGPSNLGNSCNRGYSEECDAVFRARATAFACLTWFSLFLAWCLVDPRRSFFRMQPDSKRYFTQWAFDVWRNQFLFWSIMVGLVLMFPIIYIPVINHDVFSHTGISWEWAIVFVAAIIFLSGVESWKWAKRVYFRRFKEGGGAREGEEESVVEKRVFGSFLKNENSF